MVVSYRIFRTAFQHLSIMNSWLICLAWIIAFAASPVSQSIGQEWKVRLDDGSIATGQLIPSGNDDTIAIQVAGFQSPFQLNASAIVSLSLQDSKTENATEQQQGMLHFELVDGNCFTGKLTSVDNERITIESPVLGRLHIDRSRLRSISSNNNLGKRLYDGPSNDDRWFSGKSSETTAPIESTSLATLEGGITAATNLELPEQSHIMLELTWNGTPNFVIVLGTTQTTFKTRIEEAKASARLEVWNDKLVLVRETDISSDVVSLLDLSNLIVKQVRINIHLDQRNGEIVVMNDVGRLLGRLKQKVKKSQVGKCFQISNYGDPLSLDHLQVREWSESLVRTDGEKDTVALKDGQTLMASLDGWDAAGERFLMKTPNGDQTGLNLTDLRQMNLSPIAVEPIPATQNQPVSDFPFVVLSDQSRFQAKFLASSTDRLKLEVAGLSGNYEIACSQIANVFGTSRKAGGDTTTTGRNEWLLGKVGMIKMDKTELGGRLAFDGEGKGSAALVWQPLGSRNASSLNENANGLIVFQKEASARAQSRKEESPITKPNDTLLFLGGRKKVDNPVSGQLAFENGDVIDGKILQIDEQGVTFESKQTTCRFASHELIQSISLSVPSSKSTLSPDLMKRLTTVPRTQRDHAPTHLLISISGDHMRGRLQSLNHGEIEMDVRNNTSKIPLASVSTIIWLHHRDWQEAEATKDVASEKQATEDFSIHVVRKNNRGMTFHARSLVDGKLSGVSDLFGECSVDLEEADRIFFGSDISKHVKSFRQYPWTLSLGRYPLAFLENEGKDGPAGSVLIGKKAEDFTLKSIDGSEFQLEQYRGRIVVLDFWASWCGPCMQSMPKIDELILSLQSDKILLVAVNVQESADTAQAALKRLGIHPTTLLDEQGKVAASYGATAIPQTVVINADGMIKEVIVGGDQQARDRLRTALLLELQ